MTVEAPSHGGPASDLKSRPKGLAGVALTALTAVSVVGVAFHIWTAGAGPLAGFKQTTLHVLFGVLVCLLNVESVTGSKRPRYKTTRMIDGSFVLVEIAIALTATVYVWHHFDRLVYELGYARPTTWDIILGTLMVLVVFDAARRAMGLAFPIIGLVVVLYVLYGDGLPGVLGHSGSTFTSMVANFFTSPRGIYGSITATSANQIAIFVIFGALLMRLGGGDGFLKLALVAAGRLRGGPGKVSVLASALFGMVNGSAVANTASTGAMTIPMMKRYGFRPRFAAGVEATASTGGQWTPPIMGAAVFLMAQLLGTSYYAVAFAALVPAVIYYIAFWMTVHAEASRSNLAGMRNEDIPKVRTFVDEIVILVPPVAVLLTMIFLAYPVRMAGFAATVVLLLSAAVVHLVWRRTRLKDFVAEMVRACVDAAITVATIAVLVAGSQVVVVAVGSTGFALNVGSLVFSIASVSVILALVLAAVINIVLGLALPTVPSYLIAIAITGPGLIELGVEPLAVHLFALYFAVIGGLTPPIGATVFVAAAIAKTDWLPTCFTALRIAGIGIVLPFVFALRPELLLLGELPAIATTAALVTVGGIFMAMGLAMYGVRRLHWWEAGAFLAVAAALFYPSTLLNMAGGAGAAILTLVMIITVRRRPDADKSIAAVV